MQRIRIKAACVWIGITSVAFTTSPNLSFCLVHHRSHSHVYRGWEHVVMYWNKTYGGIKVGGNTSILQLQMNLIDGDLPQPDVWWDKWRENVDWGCKVALVQSDIYPFIETAAYLEDQGLIVMLASGIRWNTNPRTLSFWETVWNGAISSALYHASYLSALASRAIQNLCLINLKGWQFGKEMSAHAANSARNLYGITVTSYTYDHRKSELDVQREVPASMRDDVFVDPYHPNTWDFVLETCADADALLGFMRDDGLSLLNFLKSNNRVFKGIFLTNVNSYMSLAADTANFVMTAAQWDESAASSCDIFGSNSEFVTSFKEHYGSTPDYMAALTAFNAAVVLLAANRSNSLAVPQINKAIDNLENYDTKTFFGAPAWSRKNYNGRAPVLLQVFQSNLYAVFPASIASQPLILPAPTLEARRGCPEGKTGDQKVNVRGNTIVLSCAGCSPGYVLNLSQHAPEVPSIGLLCDACPVGKFADTSGMSSCISCLPGSFSNMMGSQKCILCLSGRYVDSLGQSSCTSCELGTYSATRGNAGCFSCPPTTTTAVKAAMTKGDCVCPINSYYFNKISQCVECTAKELVGLECPGWFAPWSENHTGARGDTTLIVKDSYMVVDLPSVKETLAVFECATESSCKGDRQVFIGSGVNVHGMCTGRSKNICCAECVADTRRVGDGTCEACTGSIVLTCITLLGGSILFGFFTIHQTMFPFSAIGGIQLTLLSFAQAFALCLVFDIGYPHVLTAASSGTNVLVRFDFPALAAPTGCITGPTFLPTFVWQLCNPMSVAVGQITIFLVSRCLFYAFPSSLTFDQPQSGCILIMNKMALEIQGRTLSTQLRWFWPLRWPDLLNALVQLAFRFFISIANIALSLFKFHTHPSTGDEGKSIRTLVNFKQVQAWSSDWWSGLPVAVIAMLVYIIGPFAFIVYIVLVAPRRASDPRKGKTFRRSYRAIWREFRPGAWWFGLVHLLNDLGLNMATVIFVNARRQITFSIFLTLITIILTIFKRPHVFGVNLATVIVSKCGILGVLVALTNCKTGDELGETELGAMVLFFPSFVFFFIFTQTVYFVLSRKIRKRGFSVECANMGQRLYDVSTIVSAQSAQELREFAFGLIDLDRQKLTDAMDTILFNMIGLQNQKPWKYRIGSMPFEVNVEGRVEGELAARGLHSSEDPREQIRRLMRVMESIYRDSDRMSPTSSLQSRGYQFKKAITGDRSNQFVSDVVDEVFAIAGTDSFTEAAFVEAFRTYMFRYYDFSDKDVLSEEQLTKIFYYCNYDGNEYIDKAELKINLCAVTSLVYPKYKPEVNCEMESEEDQEEVPERTSSNSWQRWKSKDLHDEALRATSSVSLAQRAENETIPRATSSVSTATIAQGHFDNPIRAKVEKSAAASEEAAEPGNLQNVVAVATPGNLNLDPIHLLQRFEETVERNQPIECATQDANDELKATLDWYTDHWRNKYR